MRKITQEARYALQGGSAMHKSNTRVENGSMFLHGHEIVKGYGTPDYTISLCGWNTNTTRERLNGLDGVSVTTKIGQAYLNGYKWDGAHVNPHMFKGNISDTDTEKRNKKRKAIKAYAKLYANGVPMPSGGDCWFCALTDAGKHPLGDRTNNIEHFDSHIEDGYVVGSLLVNAMRHAGYNDMQIAVHLHVPQTSWNFENIVRKYLYRKLGV